MNLKKGFFVSEIKQATPTVAPVTPLPRAGVLQLRIDLVDIPFLARGGKMNYTGIWRRVLVPDTITLADLHCVIRESMGWLDCHLHAFEGFGEDDIDVDLIREYKALGMEYVPLMIYGDDENRFEPYVYVNFHLNETGDTLRYTYDMGDNWSHIVTLEDILPAEAGKGLGFDMGVGTLPNCCAASQVRSAAHLKARPQVYAIASQPLR